MLIINDTCQSNKSQGERLSYNKQGRVELRLINKNTINHLHCKSLVHQKYSYTALTENDVQNSDILHNHIILC